MLIPPFRFKQFDIYQGGAAHPMSTDSVLLGSWAGAMPAPERILDVGTGTGVVALMLAQRFPDAKITAVDIHAESVACAGRNFARTPWGRNLEAIAIPIQKLATNSKASFDLIASNPPFFSETIVSPEPGRRLGRNTASMPPGELIQAVKSLLASNGKFCLVLPLREGMRFCELAALEGLYHTAVTAVRALPQKPVERLLLQFEFNPFHFEKKEMTIYATQGVYSNAFIEQTREFYLDEHLLQG
jgi:tRNA1Val (adenine37-N6)-methyltransferase